MRLTSTFTLDIDISYEEANFIKETFIRDYNLREMALLPVKSTAVDLDLAPGEIKFESVDQIVTDQITNIESDFYDPKLLLKIYQNLIYQKLFQLHMFPNKKLYD